MLVVVSCQQSAVLYLSTKHYRVPCVTRKHTARYSVSPQQLHAPLLSSIWSLSSMNFICCLTSCRRFCFSRRKLSLSSCGYSKKSCESESMTHVPIWCAVMKVLNAESTARETQCVSQYQTLCNRALPRKIMKLLTRTQRKRMKQDIFRVTLKKAYLDNGALI